MSWPGELLDLYERNVSEIGVIRYRAYKNKGKTELVPYVLLPPFHTTVTAQAEVVINENGDFIGASKVPSEDKLTIIPVTEKSGIRTSGKEPHPLCDNLQYLASDYGEYVKDSDSCYDMYRNVLGAWHQSKYTHPKVDAVFSYLEKRTLLEDLIREKVLTLDAEGMLDEHVKIQNVVQSKAFVRFVVRGNSVKENSVDECWKDHSLQNAFIEYTRSMQKEKALDYLTGNYETPSYLHSKKIRNEGDGAKLISSNDEINYTFRGRFVSKEQAFSIGSETSQKMHSALKWIIRKQGYSYDTMVIVTWESNMLDMPPWDADTEALCSGTQENQDLGISGDDEDVLAVTDDFVEPDEKEEEKLSVYNTNFITAGQFSQALDGYRERVENTSRMVLMAFDAATSGRLSLAEYETLETTKYLDNIKAWHEQCCWRHEKYKNKTRIIYEGIPGIRDIANILYGFDSGKIPVLNIRDKNGKKLYAQFAKRLRPCIWDGRRLPYDLVNLAVSRASSPQSYVKRYNWERVLALACSFVKKYRYDQKKEEWNVALDENCRDRNYLYGRLLAVADRIEYQTFSIDQDSDRTTNAKRYMSTFSQRPFETWRVIEENLQPYLNKLPAKKRRFYGDMLDNICQMFDIEDFQKNTKLDGLYLLGFHSQSFALKYNQKENEKEKEKAEGK